MPPVCSGSRQSPHPFCLKYLFRETHLEGILTRSLIYFNQHLLTYKCRGSTQSSFMISDLITLSISVNPETTLRRFIFQSLTRAYNRRLNVKAYPPLLRIKKKELCYGSCILTLDTDGIFRSFYGVAMRNPSSL